MWVELIRDVWCRLVRTVYSYIGHSNAGILRRQEIEDK
jgi:hypothetical protein